MRREKGLVRPAVNAREHPYLMYDGITPCDQLLLMRRFPTRVPIPPNTWGGWQNALTLFRITHFKTHVNVTGHNPRIKDIHLIPRHISPRPAKSHFALSLSHHLRKTSSMDLAQEVARTEVAGFARRARAAQDIPGDIVVAAIRAFRALDATWASAFDECLATLGSDVSVTAAVQQQTEWTALMKKFNRHRPRLQRRTMAPSSKPTSTMSPASVNYSTTYRSLRLRTKRSNSARRRWPGCLGTENRSILVH